MFIAPVTLPSVVLVRGSIADLTDAGAILRSLARTGDAPCPRGMGRPGRTPSSPVAEGIQRLASARGPEVPARRQLSDIGSALDILIDRITNAVGPSQIHVPTWITRETAELLDAIAVCTQLLTRALIVLDQPVRITALAEQLRRRADGAVRASSDSLRGPEPDLYERLSGVIDAFGVIATTLARSASSSPVSARSHAVPRRQRQHPTTAVDEATPTVDATSSDETADTGHHVAPQPQSGDRTRDAE